MNRILIIGGGAAGMAAAISAAQANPSAQITILDGLDRIGKKILATETAMQLHQRSRLRRDIITRRIPPA